jgi:hypothetical protein
MVVRPRARAELEGKKVPQKKEGGGASSAQGHLRKPSLISLSSLLLSLAILQSDVTDAEAEAQLGIQLEQVSRQV